ncbi:MAG: DUF6873 family GME fold protein [Tissierella sp.]|uniref:DUF6873 family GME fold protein n=1 Tax=Tissierella sp. TaxID=41274 RepID=UPI003F9C1005
MKNPFIPLKKADTVIVAGNIDEDIYDNLIDRNLRVIKTIAHPKVDNSIKYHPDIVVHPINHNILVTEPTVYEYYKEEFKSTNIKIIKGERKLNSKYPLDIAYNVGRVSDFAIHNFEHTDEVLKFHLKKENLELINVNQGYSKCSIAVIGDREIITADHFIYTRLKDKGIESLLINPGHITLENQDYGFIGGCTGNMSNKEVFLSGSLKNHPGKENIERFIKNAGKKIIYLSNKKIVDIGTIISLNCN